MVGSPEPAEERRVDDEQHVLTNFLPFGLKALDVVLAVIGEDRWSHAALRNSQKSVPHQQADHFVGRCSGRSALDDLFNFAFSQNLTVAEEVEKEFFAEPRDVSDLVTKVAHQIK